MANEVTVRAVGDKHVLTRRLRVVARKVRRMHIPNRQIAVWLLRWVNENFKSEGGKVGGWKPFKLGGRRLPGGKIDRSAKLLQDTGRLRQSFNKFSSRRFAGVGTNLNYAISHEFGLPHKNLPARRMLMTADDPGIGSTVIRIYNRHIRRSIR